MYPLLRQILYIRMWTEDGNLINDLLLNVPLGFLLMRTSSLPTKCSMTLVSFFWGLRFCGPLPWGNPTTRSYDKHGEGQWGFLRHCSRRIAYGLYLQLWFTSSTAQFYSGETHGKTKKILRFRISKDTIHMVHNSAPFMRDKLCQHAT